MLGVRRSQARATLTHRGCSYNAYGQLGLGLAIDKFGNTTAQTGDGLPFVNLGTSQTATQISAGYWYTCAILTGGVKCWGCAAPSSAQPTPRHAG